MKEDNSSGVKEYLTLASFGLSTWLIIFGVALFLIFIIFGYHATTASDWLIFAGSSIGGVATLSAIYVTYEQNNKHHKESIRLQDEKDRKSIMPFINISPIEKTDLSSGMPDETFNRALKIGAGDFHPVFTPNISQYYSPEYAHNFKNNEYYYRKLTITNIGADSAFNININVQNQTGFKGLALCKNEGFTCFVEIDASHSGNFYENYVINFEIEFSDLAGRKYVQHNSCEVNSRDFIQMPAPKISMPELLE